MANDNTQVRPNTGSHFPEKVLRIEGERTAVMFALAVRVSRLDVRLRDLASNPRVESRKQYRLADEGFQKLIANFEDGLAAIEKDAELNTRRGNNEQRRGGEQPRRANQSRGQQPVAKAAATQQPQAKPPAAAPQAPAAPVEAAPQPAAQVAPATQAPKPAQPDPKQKQKQKPQNNGAQNGGKGNGLNGGAKQSNGQGNNQGQSKPQGQQQKPKAAAQQPKAAATVTL